jgi:hypothetical protein
MSDVNSKTKHTPGNVEVSGNALHSGCSCVALTDGNDRHANARRIAALWNAANRMGLSTEAIEEGVLSDLLEALKELLPFINAGQLPGSVYNPSLSKAYRAITKAQDHVAA